MAWADLSSTGEVCARSANLGAGWACAGSICGEGPHIPRCAQVAGHGRVRAVFSRLLEAVGRKLATVSAHQLADHGPVIRDYMTAWMAFPVRGSGDCLPGRFTAVPDTG